MGWIGCGHLPHELRSTGLIKEIRINIIYNFGAVLYYSSWWDFGGIEFEIGGIDPNCLLPKPRPTTPRDFFELIYFLYQKGNLGSDHFKTRPNVIQPMFFH